MFEKAADYLFMQGVLGIWAALSTGWAIWATLGWLDEKNKRLQDNKDYDKLTRDTEKEHFVTIDNLKQAINAAITIFSSRKE